MIRIISISFLLINLNLSDTLVSTVKNLRPVVEGSLYRCATLDNLSVSDAQLLLEGGSFGISPSPLKAVIDLRNEDEIKKGKGERTEGANLLYSSNTCKFLHIPLLQDIDGFWEEAINRMDPKDRFLATINTVFQGGALDRAAAKNFEKGGHAMLNTIIMSSGRIQIKKALQACLEESEQGPVIFHCQKGKDRTGVLGMLIQSTMGSTEDEIIQSYAISGKLLDENEGCYTSKDKISDGSTGLIDWSYFRGSPAKGMIETLDWTRERYGSVPAYLEAACSFDLLEQGRFREDMSSRV
jgi:hypothetical protein